MGKAEMKRSLDDQTGFGISDTEWNCVSVTDVFKSGHLALSFYQDDFFQSGSTDTYWQFLTAVYRFVSKSTI